MEHLKSTEKADVEEAVLRMEKSDFKIDFRCPNCGTNGEINAAKDTCVKLPWRIDWPMRWRFEKVDFEPGGKDHSNAGGSIDTARIISKEVFNYAPPSFLRYDFVRIKGRGGKISSSSGDVISLDELIAVYEPEIARYLFVSVKVDVEFSIGFDSDVIKFYDAYDRLEKQYFGVEEASKSKKDLLFRNYELSQISEVRQKLPRRVPFREVGVILQICNMDVKRTVGRFVGKIGGMTDSDVTLLRRRIQCAKNWLEKHADESFVFRLREEADFALTDLEIEFGEKKEQYFDLAMQIKKKINQIKLSNNNFKQENNNLVGQTGNGVSDEVNMHAKPMDENLKNQSFGKNGLSNGDTAERQVC